MECVKCQVFFATVIALVLVTTSVEASIRRFDLDDLKLLWKKTSSEDALTRFLKKNHEYRKIIEEEQPKEEIEIIPLEETAYIPYNPYNFIGNNQYDVSTPQRTDIKYVDASNFRGKNVETQDVQTKDVVVESAPNTSTTTEASSISSSSRAQLTGTTTIKSSEESSTEATSPVVVSWDKSLLIDRPVHFGHIPYAEPDKSDRYSHSIVYGHGVDLF